MQILAINLSHSFPSTLASLPPHEALSPLLRFVDADSVEQVTRFRRLEDAQRCLLGRLLPRYLLATEFGAPWSSINFGKTATGRPFALAHPLIPASFDFNVSHDSNFVVLGSTRSPESRIGVDVIRIKVPWEEGTTTELLQAMHDQLTTGELHWVSASPNSSTTLLRALSLWTLKESYSKALGVGLKFDFKRIEFSFSEAPSPSSSVDELSTVRLDVTALKGWKFWLDRVDDEHLLAVALQECFPSDEDESSDLRSRTKFVTLEEIVAVARMESTSVD